MTSDLSPQCAADATLQLNRPRALFPFSLLLSVKHPKPESGRQREMVVGMVRLQPAEFVFSSTVGETSLQVLSCSGWKKKHFHFTFSLVVWCLQLAGSGSKGFCG